MCEFDKIELVFGDGSIYDYEIPPFFSEMIMIRYFTELLYYKITKKVLIFATQLFLLRNLIITILNHLLFIIKIKRN